MSRTFTLVNRIMAGLFLLSAALQYNDPDPWRWTLLYAAAAAACLLAGRSRLASWLAAAVAAVTLVWAASLSPILPEVRPTDLVKTMKAENPTIELGREFLGLVIVLAWMILLLVVTRPRATGAAIEPRRT
jgi:hypothetical protein